MAAEVQPVVLAGGAGTRLWPISTEKRPKHLLQIVGSGTMLTQTLERVSDGALVTQGGIGGHHDGHVFCLSLGTLTPLPPTVVGEGLG